MKSQDIFLLFKLVSLQQTGQNDEDTPVTPHTVRALALETGISKSQISLALHRCYDVTLAKPDRQTGAPCPNIKALEEFIIYGIRYVFPAKLQELTRGIVTGLAAPVLKGELMTAGELVPVWADAQSKTKGQRVEPLFKTVPQAIRRDQRLYAFLALTDAIRLGQARERAVAADKLSNMLRGKE